MDQVTYQKFTSQNSITIHIGKTLNQEYLNKKVPNKQMQQFLQKIRTHFNIIHTNDSLSLTLINPNLDLDIIRQIKQTFRLQLHIKKQQIIIIESVTFDDELLEQLAEALPQSLQELSLDFTGCESLRGSGFLTLFQRISTMELRKLKLDLSEVYDVNDNVIQGLSLLLQNMQQLQEFYLDLYEVDQITQDGYLLLAQSLSSLPNLKSLHLDFSANPNLTEDNLELLFTNIVPENLEKFQFRILDIDHIGGGSFFKLGEVLAKMANLQILQLTISTFSNLNHKGIYAVLKEITYLQKLKQLTLNLSNIQLPPKILSYINVPPVLELLNLDVSCNSLLTDGDILTVIKNIKNLTKLSLNVDFCDKVTDDSLEELLQIYLKNQKCQELSLPDRKLSQQLIQFIIVTGSEATTLQKVQLAEGTQETNKDWKSFLDQLEKKRTLLFAGAIAPIHQETHEQELVQNAPTL